MGIHSIRQKRLNIRQGKDIGALFRIAHCAYKQGGTQFTLNGHNLKPEHISTLRRALGYLEITFDGGKKRNMSMSVPSIPSKYAPTKQTRPVTTFKFIGKIV